MSDATALGLVPVPVEDLAHAVLWLSLEAGTRPMGEPRTELERAAGKLQDAIDRWAARPGVSGEAWSHEPPRPVAGLR